MLQFEVTLPVPALLFPIILKIILWRVYVEVHRITMDYLTGVSVSHCYGLCSWAVQLVSLFLEHHYTASVWVRELSSSLPFTFLSSGIAHNCVMDRQMDRRTDTYILTGPISNNDRRSKPTGLTQEIPRGSTDPHFGCAPPCGPSSKSPHHGKGSAY